jgi:predicted Zn finger-like uncharacterized protein
MSLITGCPACGTMFRVVPDQLKISEGWVRCGHCGEVFDATAHLTDESGPEAMPAQEHARPDATPSDTDAVADLPPPTTLLARPESEAVQPAPDEEPFPPDAAAPVADLASGPELEADPTPEPGPLARREVDAEDEVEAQDRVDAEDRLDDEELSSLPPAGGELPTDTARQPEDADLEPSPLDTPFVFRRSDLIAPEDEAVRAHPRASRFDEQPEELTPAEVQDMDFVRQAQRQQFWRRPGVRIGLVIAGFTLAALLVLQVVHRDRDRLALAEPALRPALEGMCRLLACTLSAPRQIESLAIESSGFNRLRNDTYRLAFTLRSTARVPLAVPAMELTITDVQDQPIARRVLVPADFGAATDVIPATGDLSRAVGLVIAPTENARVAGYRLLAFYP